MDEATIALGILSIAIMAVFLGFLIWGIKSKQFRNIEESKYQLFKETAKDEESPKKPRSPMEDDSEC
jgi:nitrogen fixation-related uncharacterized protein